MPKRRNTVGKKNRDDKNGKKNQSLYDDNGILIQYQKNLCDCLDDDCPGCYFPCPKCSSEKCGFECRNNRRWTYESLEVEGTDIVYRNKYRN